MKKSFLALALMSAFSGAAFAQSSVTIYGIVDMGWFVMTTVLAQKLLWIVAFKTVHVWASKALKIWVAV
jgi:predicted porin